MKEGDHYKTVSIGVPVGRRLFEALSADDDRQHIIALIDEVTDTINRYREEHKFAKDVNDKYLVDSCSFHSISLMTG